ncbi:metallopeptidase TldD-related protein [Alphaproteobacteria bacterium]|nr:metallopeptidase TldD-related protein [Alphaproteobacteria bacterium]
MKKVYDFGNDILNNYKSFNIDDVEVITSENISLSVKSRQQKLENIERSESFNIGINIYKDKKKATISSNNIDSTDAKEYLEKGSAMVKSMPIDEYSGLANKKDYASEIEDLDLEDTIQLSEKQLLDQALLAENAMLKNKKITNSEGATRSFSKNTYNIINSRGFNAKYSKTFHSISSIAIAGSDTNMQRDYEYSAATHASDLLLAEEVGSLAAKRAASRLNSKKIKSCTLDVIFEPRVAKSILSSFCSCASGTSIARGTSFLNNQLNTSIFKKNINITNNPKLKRGIGSAPYDSSGIKTNNISIIQDGIFKNYFLNIRSARQLKMAINGNSSPSNLILNKGDQDIETIIKNIKNGFLVTEMLGMSFNPINGDYSRGATGFKIENGEITYPVSEVTIAGNLAEMLKNLIPANDLKINDNINSPSILIEGMTLAGL